MAKHHIHDTCKIGDLSNQKILDLTADMTGMKLESDLKREVRGNILRLRDMGTYRGRRHAMGLPVRGQNTKSGQVSSALGMVFLASKARW
jgi:small subunit ribosomal protein S13